MECPHAPAPTLYHHEADNTQARLIFIITASPVLAAAVGDYFRDLDGELSVVWMTSADRALKRLGLERAAWVILDDLGPSTNAHVAALSAAAPGAKIMLLAGGRLPSRTGNQADSVASDELPPPHAEAGAHREPSSLLRFQRSTEDQALAGHLNGLR